MAITTLTKHDRAKIRNAILKHAYHDKLLALSLRRQTLAYNLHAEIVDVEALEHLSEPWVTRSATEFGVGGDGEILRFSIEGRPLDKPQDFLRIFGHGTNGWWTDCVDKLDPIVLPSAGSRVLPRKDMKSVKQRYYEIQTEYENLCNEIVRHSCEIDALLGTTTSVAKLVKSWPEVKRFLPELQRASTTLPATRDLNKALNLP